MSFQFLPWAFFFCVAVREGLSYGSLSVPNHMCHSCANGTYSVICRCDNMCGFYNDCCFDAPVTSNRRFRGVVGLSCLQQYLRNGFYAVDKCSSSWSSPNTVLNKCENRDDFTDPLISIPVTDTYTHITYSNRYCAECNYVDPYYLSSFALRLNCDEELIIVNNTFGNITQDFVSQNMMFINDSWGVYHWNPLAGGMSFFSCRMSSEVPGNMLSLLRHCYPYMISSCAYDWNDELMRQKCIFSNMNIVYSASSGDSYRNVYCAVCNYLSTNQIGCIPVDPFFVGQPLPSFTMLLDINPTNDKEFCPPNKIYDMYFEKCRTLFCTEPGHVARDGKCVKE